MKKIYLLLLLFVSIGVGVNAQCTINHSDTALGLSPPDSLLPDITRNVPYDTVIQVYVPHTFTYDGFTVNLVWIIIDSITNAPTGIEYAHNPATDTILAGNNACYQIYGTTTDTAGVYPLAFSGFVRFNAPPIFNNDTTFPLSELSLLSAGGPSPFSFSLRVDNTTAINDISGKLASVMQVQPNPNNGQFDVKLNYNGELTGDIRVLDALGNTVYVRPMSSKGLYTSTINLANLPKGIYAVQLSTPNGTASKLISVE